MEMLLKIFFDLLLIVGILTALLLIYILIMTPVNMYQESKKKKKSIEELKKYAERCMQEIVENEKEKNTINSIITTKTDDLKTETSTRKTRKKQEN